MQSAELLAEVGLDSNTLDAIPEVVVIGRPIFDDAERLEDIEIVWLNAYTRQFEATSPMVGLRLTQLVPDLKTSGWLAKMADKRVAGNQALEPHFMLRMGKNTVPYAMDAYWHNGFVVAVAFEQDGAFATPLALVHAIESITNLMKHTPVAFGVLTDDGWSRSATEAFCQGFGKDRSSFKNMNILENVIDEDKPKVDQWIADSSQKEPASMLVRVKCGHAEPRYVEAWIAEINATDDGSLGKLAIFRDLDAQIRGAKAVEAAKNNVLAELGVLSKALNVSRDGFAIWTSVRDANLGVDDFQLDFINATGAAATGKAPSKLIGKRMTQVLDGEQSRHLHSLFETALSSQQEVVDVVELDTEAGWVGAYENRVMPLSLQSVVTSFRDISEQRKEEKRLQWLVNHDHLTGLASRQALEDRLEAALAAGRLTGNPVAFAFIDLDHFKSVNDTYGHPVGDEVLKTFGERLGEAVDGNGFVARISGDEFAYLVNNIRTIDEAEAFSLRVQHVVQGAYELGDGRKIDMTCSAGLALVKSLDAGASEVMRVADRAMYAVKLNGRASYKIVTL